jgi:hypothetical protein
MLSSINQYKPQEKPNEKNQWLLTLSEGHWNTPSYRWLQWLISCHNQAMTKEIQCPKQ